MTEKKKRFIDVDCTVVDPSPQRVRNILTMEERVQAILAYDCRPMYTKVAKMFNCSWEQIKNIIQNRDAIMEFYEATKKSGKVIDPDRDEIRRRKILFLGECMYEYIQRAQFHLRTDLTEELIRMKAIEFRDIMQIENFIPNKAWINHFKATYNFSLSNRQITLTRTPPASLDLKTIMTYCSKNKSNIPNDKNTVHTPPIKDMYRAKTQMELLKSNEETLAELRQRNSRKMNLLQKALYEYVMRMQYHKKTVELYELNYTISLLMKILKLDYPTSKLWFDDFKKRFNVNVSNDIVSCAPSNETPPLSLDLRDILSYVSRIEYKNQNNQSIVKLTPKNVRTIAIRKVLVEAAQPNVALTVTTATATATATTTTTTTTVKTRATAKTTVTTIPKSTTTATTTSVTAAATPAKTTTSIKQKKQQQQQNQPVTEIVKTQMPNAIKITNYPVVPFPEIKTEIIDLDDCDELDIKPEIEQLIITKNTTENLNKVDNDDTPPIKKPKIEPTLEEEEEENLVIEAKVQSPGHWSEHSEQNEENEQELPKVVNNCEDALKILKPLEEYAMLIENYRAIGLISQLENIFKNLKK